MTTPQRCVQCGQPAHRQYEISVTLEGPLEETDHVRERIDHALNRAKTNAHDGVRVTIHTEDMTHAR